MARMRFCAMTNNALAAAGQACNQQKPLELISGSSMRRLPRSSFINRKHSIDHTQVHLFRSCRQLLTSINIAAQRRDKLCHCCKLRC